MKITKGVSFKKRHRKISFSGEYESDPKSYKDWSLNVLTVPDEKKPDHEHFFLNQKEVENLYEYLGLFLEHVDKLKSKSK